MLAGVAAPATLLLLIMAGAHGLKCYHPATTVSLQDKINLDALAVPPSWPSLQSYPNGLIEHDCSVLKEEQDWGTGGFCLKIVMRNASIQQEVATGSCYRSLLVLSGIQCDSNGKSGQAYSAFTNQSYTYYCCTGNMCNSSPRQLLIPHSALAACLLFCFLFVSRMTVYV